MKTIELLLIGCLSGSLLADRTLSSSEINDIINTLTETPRTAWLETGTIEAHHLEFYDSEQNAVESTEVVRFDGNTYIWDIRLEENNLSETIPAVPKKPQASPDMDSQMNRHRIFSWNGQKYVRYYKSANYAVVETTGQDSSADSNGPLTAGLIPWGIGFYSKEKLLSCQKQAIEKTVDNVPQILLSLTTRINTTEVKMDITLDPQRGYAVTHYLMQDAISGIEQKYDRFLSIQNRWVPTQISIEQFQKQSSERKLVSYEDWKLETILPEKPAASSLNVSFENGTLVELQASQYLSTLQYHASETIDITELLQEKIALSNQPADAPHNCATAAANLIAKRFDRTLSLEQLNRIVIPDSKMTSLYILKDTLQQAGLFCLAVETSLHSLREIGQCQIILHLPTSNHYIILDHIDDQNVWAIDLTSRKLYYKVAIKDFQMEWTAGTALLVTDAGHKLPMQVGTPISDTRLQQILGGDTVGYSCTDQLQINQRVNCSQPLGLLCQGAYYVFIERYGCKEDAKGGTCLGERMLGYQYSRCKSVVYQPGVCRASGDTYSRYIRACK